MQQGGNNGAPLPQRKHNESLKTFVHITYIIKRILGKVNYIAAFWHNDVAKTIQSLRQKQVDSRKER